MPVCSEVTSHSHVALYLFVLAAELDEDVSPFSLSVYTTPSVPNSFR